MCQAPEDAASTIVDVETYLRCSYKNVPVTANICPVSTAPKNIEEISRAFKETLSAVGINVESAQQVCCTYSKYWLCMKQLTSDDVAQILWQVATCKKMGPQDAYMRASRFLALYHFKTALHPDDERPMSLLIKNM